VLTYLKVENFKSLRSVDVDSAPLNAVIGPNGVGKSSLLQAIDFLRAFMMDSVQMYLDRRQWQFADLPNVHGKGKVIRWELLTEIPPREDGECGGGYAYLVSLQPRRHLGIGTETLMYRDEPIFTRRGRMVGFWDAGWGKIRWQEWPRTPASVMAFLREDSHREEYPHLCHFRDWIEGFRSFLFWDPKVLRQQSRGEQHELGPSGENLVGVLATLQREQPEAFHKLVRRVSALLPTASRISIAGGRQTWGWKELRLHEKAQGREASFRGTQISDGTLRLLALASLLYMDKPPSLITLEEPENGMHPQLLREVVGMLRELTLRKPPNQCQVFFATHSPYVLDEFIDSPECIYVMERAGPQAGTEVHRLSENSNLPRIKEAYEGSLGEAWYSGLIGGTAGAKKR